MKTHSRAAEGVFIIIILISLLVCPWLYAEEETLPTPEEIIAKNIEAIGGINTLNKVKNKKTVTIRKIFKMNRNTKATEYRERPNKYYRELGWEGSDTGTREGSDGKIAWEISPSPGTCLFEGGQLSDVLRNTLFDGADGPDARYKSMKTEGIEQINEKDCYKVVKTPEKGDERIVYYDNNSYMIVKITTDMTDSQGNIKYEIYNEEYKKINGIFFPYKQVDFLNGQKYSEYTTEKIELNIEMPEGIFNIPEEIKAIMNRT